MAKETAPASAVKLPPQLLQRIMQIGDAAVAFWPQPKPSSDAIAQCNIIGHRGCKDVAGIIENSFDAFDAALAAGAHGIELDIRFTADNVIVVAHDPDLKRVHGQPSLIANTTFNDLRQQCPAIPTLSEVIQRYAGKLCLYIELKTGEWQDVATRQRQLLETLSDIDGEKDYFILSFDIDLLKALDKIPASHKVAIMHSNPSDMKAFLAEGHAGTVGGHYLLLTQAFRAFCKQHQVKIGVGFPASRNSLWRELKRGAVFAFVDNPQKAKNWL